MRNKGIRIEYERWVAKKVRKVCTLDRLVLDAEEGEESFTVYLRFSGNEVHGLIRSWGFSFV